MNLFIHHRDLRHFDNEGLIKSCESGPTYPIFIFDPEQISHKNKYYNPNSIDFMKKSLYHLYKTSHISFFMGTPEHVLESLIKKHEVAEVHENEDFSPFAKTRQASIAKICKKHDIKHVLHSGVTLMPMGTFCRSGKAYKKFTPFYKNASTYPIPKPDGKKLKLHAFPADLSFLKEVSHFRGKMGRRAGLAILSGLADFKSYNKCRDLLTYETTHMSEHLHFGTLSPREVYHSILMHCGKNSILLQQIYWREFYMYIVNYVNTDYSKKSATLSRLNSIKWSRFSDAKFKAWCEGRTGVPIVDAGMRQLNTTHRMHNRARMIGAMYLIWYLGIHWSYGEQYFAQTLVDYSYANNFGGWVWCASAEVYSNDSFRVFSMESQSKRYDPKGEYIKKYVPELQDIEPKKLHRFEEFQDDLAAAGYPRAPNLKELKEARLREYRLALRK